MCHDIMFVIGTSLKVPFDACIFSFLMSMLNSDDAPPNGLVISL